MNSIGAPCSDDLPQWPYITDRLEVNPYFAVTGGADPYGLLPGRDLMNGVPGHGGASGSIPNLKAEFAHPGLCKFAVGRPTEPDGRQESTANHCREERIPLEARPNPGRQPAQKQGADGGPQQHLPGAAPEHLVRLG